MKKNKIFLIVLLATTLLSTNAMAETNCPEGTTLGTSCWKCGDNCTAYLSNDPHEGGNKQLNITGTGPISEHGGWSRYTYAAYGPGIITSVNIEQGITSIGNSAFSYNTSVERVTIPDSVTSIGESAFNQAYAYTDLTDRIDTIVLSENLEQIGNKAFSRSTATSIILPESLFADGRELNPYAFEYMALDTIYCPEGNQKCLSYVPMLCLGEDLEVGCDGESEPLSKQPTFNTYRQDANGNYIINGIRYSSYSDMVKNKNAHPMRRMYTVEEAAKASKDTGNTIKLRYK